MGMLEDFYGIEGAKRFRAQRAREFGAAPTQQQVTQLTPEMKAVLKGRMEMILSALEAGRVNGYQVAAAITAATKLPGPIGTIVGLFTTPEEGKIAVLAFFAKSMPIRIANARAAMNEVLAGTMSIDKWIAGRKEDAKGMVSLLQQLGANTVAANVTETISDVWSDIASGITWISTKAREIPQSLPSTQVMVYLGLALGAFVLYQYATAPLKLLPSGRSMKLSGYKRRKK